MGGKVEFVLVVVAVQPNALIELLKNHASNHGTIMRLQKDLQPLNRVQCSEDLKNFAML
jgi:hypothetical protein